MIWIIIWLISICFGYLFHYCLSEIDYDNKYNIIGITLIVIPIFGPLCLLLILIGMMIFKKYKR